ncbi:MAG: glycosyltransferase, partial [Candidatus Spechtbacterales bacterium]
MSKKISIIITGGGSGGHTFPLIAVIRELKKQAEQEGVKVKIVFMGPKDNSSEALKNEGIKIKNISAGKLRRYFSFRTVIDMFKIVIGIMQSWIYLGIHLPDVIFSKGGYGSVPIVLVGRLFRIPVILHESDIIPGMSNRFLSKRAEKIIVSFPKKYEEFPEEKVVYAGNPVRDLRGGDVQGGRAELGIKTNKPVILIMGGSQGAEQINALILAALPKLTSLYEIVHQTGE